MNDMRAQPKDSYVYVHRKVSDQKIFYIGKGRRRRAWSTSGRSAHWKRIVAKHGLDVVIIKSGMPEPCALSFEKILIDKSGIDTLVNVVLGGGGTQGWKHSEDTRRRIGAFHKGRKATARMLASLAAYNSTRVISDEHRLKISIARSGPRTPLSDETKRKISASHIGLRPSIESRQKMSVSKIGKASGRSSPTYDHTIRQFIHATYGMFQGTRADWIAAYGLANGCVSELINGNRKSVKGWRLA